MCRVTLPDEDCYWYRYFKQLINENKDEYTLEANINMNTTDKVQAGDSTAGTSTSTTWRYPYTPPRTEQGWECPRCGRINAPWKSQCDCGRNNYWTITDNWIYQPYDEEWWKHVYCTSKVHPETIQKTPSSVCSSDSTTTVGGSDYWNSVTKTWENVPHTLTNMQKDLDEIKATFNSTIRGE